MEFLVNVHLRAVCILLVMYTQHMTLLRAVPGLSEPGVGSGRIRSSDGRGFSERVAVPTRLSCPGFQSRTEGLSRGATAGRAERREATSAEWAVFHGDDIR